MIDLGFLHLALALVGLLGSAYYSAIEMSLVSSSRLKLRQAVKQGQQTAGLALDLLRDQEHVLATTLVGLNLFNLATAAFATSLMEDRLPLTGWKLILTSTFVVTLVILVLAEIVPKVYAKQRPERVLTFNVRAIMATEQLFLPVTALIRVYLRILLKLLRRAPRKPFVTREDLKLLVHDVKGQTGPIRKERKMLRSLLDFGETTVREVMVPMTEVVSIERDSSVDMLRALTKRHGFTRLPVYERRIDKVIGLANIYDILFDPEPKDQIVSYIREAILVPETKRIDRLMVELQRGHQTMAVVVSEFGSCVGVVTMEDIIEEIVGEMAEEDEIGVRKIREISPRTYIADALTDIDDVNDELSLALPKGRYDTLAGLLLKHFGRIPREGEIFESKGVRIEVVDVHPFGVRSVKIMLSKKRTEGPKT